MHLIDFEFHLTDALVRFALWFATVILVIAAIVTAFLLFRWAAKDYTPISARLRAEAGVRGGGSPLGWFLVMPVFAILLGYFVHDWLVSLPPYKARIMLGIGFIFLMGSALFFLKVKFLFVYAVIQLVVASLMAFRTMHELKDIVRPVDAFVMFTAIYLVVRSLEDFKKRFGKPEKCQTRATPS